MTEDRGQKTEDRGRPGEIGGLLSRAAARGMEYLISRAQGRAEGPALVSLAFSVTFEPKFAYESALDSVGHSFARGRPARL
jgi:hypothetical protein